MKALLFDKIGCRMLLPASSIELLSISSSNSNRAAYYLLRITSSSFYFFPIAFVLLPSFFSYRVAAFVLLPVFVSIKQLPIACVFFFKIELLPACLHDECRCLFLARVPSFEIDVVAAHFVECGLLNLLSVDAFSFSYFYFIRKSVITQARTVLLP